MESLFSVDATPHYDRCARSLLRRHSEFDGVEEQAREILCVDPYNRTRTHGIKKLNDVESGEGQYRLRLGRFRFRYDIFDKEVILHSCGLRREDTYQ